MTNKDAELADWEEGYALLSSQLADRCRELAASDRTIATLERQYENIVPALSQSLAALQAQLAAKNAEPIWIKCVSCETTVRFLWKRIAALEAELELKQGIILADETRMKLLEAELVSMTATVRGLEAALAKAEEE